MSPWHFAPCTRKKQQKVSFSDDILQCWRDHSDVPAKLVGEIRGAFRYRGLARPRSLLGCQARSPVRLRDHLRSGPKRRTGVSVFAIVRPCVPYPSSFVAWTTIALLDPFIQLRYRVPDGVAHLDEIRSTARNTETLQRPRSQGHSSCGLDAPRGFLRGFLEHAAPGHQQGIRDNQTDRESAHPARPAKWVMPATGHLTMGIGAPWQAG